MTPKRILVVISTFNRKDLIGLTSSYLARISFDPDIFSFVISDDCSTEYGLSFLESAYSALPHAQFTRTSRHTDAITHTWLLLKSFVNSEFDKILVFDNDLIVHESCLRWISDFDDEIVSSLYNSSFHKVEGRYGEHCTKADIGWAGALIDKSIVREMFDRFGSRPFDDWALCDLAKQKRLMIKVATPSAVEHIGITGANNVIPEFFDHSFDFPREYIDQATRDFFLAKLGLDLLRYLDRNPEHSTGDELRVFPLGPSRTIEQG